MKSEKHTNSNLLIYLRIKQDQVQRYVDSPFDRTAPFKMRNNWEKEKKKRENGNEKHDKLTKHIMSQGTFQV